MGAPLLLVLAGQVTVIESLLGRYASSVVHYLSHKAWNALMHALHGNGPMSGLGPDDGFVLDSRCPAGYTAINESTSSAASMRSLPPSPPTSEPAESTPTPARPGSAIRTTRVSGRSQARPATPPHGPDRSPLGDAVPTYAQRRAFQHRNTWEVPQRYRTL